jgi:hypothetical protein
MIAAAQNALALGGYPGESNRGGHGFGPGLEKAHLLHPGNAMAKLGGYFLLQGRGKRPDYTGLDRLYRGPGDFGVTVAEGDGAESHQIVNELAILVVPHPAAGRTHHTGGKTVVVRAEEDLGTLAAGGGEAGDVLSQCVRLTPEVSST